MRNFESGKLKVNDHDGNPIEIAAVVVWKVVDTAEAPFEVDDYEDFVRVQSEAALRNLATPLPLRLNDEERLLPARAPPPRLPRQPKDEIQERLEKAGVEVDRGAHQPPGLRARNCAAMLAGQQASAIIAARTRIVEGAVGMVEMALDRLSEKDIVSSTRSAKRRWSATCWWSCAVTERAALVNTGPSTVPAGPRGRTQDLSPSVDAAAFEALQRWAKDELRSLNAQIEFVLRHALRKGGRAPRPTALDTAAGAPPDGGPAEPK